MIYKYNSNNFISRLNIRLNSLKGATCHNSHMWSIKVIYSNIEAYMLSLAVAELILTFKNNHTKSEMCVRVYAILRLLIGQYSKLIKIHKRHSHTHHDCLCVIKGKQNEKHTEKVHRIVFSLYSFYQRVFW